MTLDPSLDALRHELERAGMLVVPHGDHICVRLPLFASIRVRLDSGRLQLDPRLGGMKAGWTLAGEFVASVVVVGAALALTGVGALSVGLGFAGLATMITDGGRLVSVESCATRIQLIWATRVADRLLGRLPSAPQLAEGDRAPQGFAGATERPWVGR